MEVNVYKNPMDLIVGVSVHIYTEFTQIVIAIKNLFGVFLKVGLG